MRQLLAIACIGTTFLGNVAAAGDVFSEGDKIFDGNRKPVVVRVNPVTEEATLFKADAIDRDAIAKLANATEAERAASMSDALASVEKRENELPLYGGDKKKDESTAACYGYYYGYYPWAYFRPIYVFITVPVIHYYSWHVYYGGYRYYWYL